MKTDAHVLDTSRVYLTSSSLPASRSDVRQFALPHPGIYEVGSDIMAPTVYAKMVVGSPLVRVDVQLGAVNSGHGDGHGNGGDRYGDGSVVLLTRNVLGHEIAGSIAGYPMSFVPSVPVVDSWKGELADGSFAPEGNYTFLVRALRVLGDEDREEDYEVVRTEEFGISYG